VSYQASGHDGSGTALTPVCNPASGSLFAIGTTQVTCSVTDGFGGTASASFALTVKDTTGPTFANVPGTVAAFATSTSGARVSYTLPTAFDAVDGARAVTCSLAPGGQFPVNKTTVTCQASDSRGNQSKTDFTIWVTYQAPTDGSFFLAPIRSNGSSIFAIGRPVPVRFQLTGASAGITNLVAKLVFTKVSSSVLGTNTDVSDETVSDTNLTFKYNPISKVYYYRWRTSDETQGTYQLRADLGDGVVHQVNVSLRSAH
jgi:hypothetical protein